MGKCGVNLDCAIPGTFTIINIKCHLDISTLWVHVVKIAVPSKGNLMTSSEIGSQRFPLLLGEKRCRKTSVSFKFVWQCMFSHHGIDAFT